MPEEGRRQHSEEHGDGDYPRTQPGYGLGGYGLRLQAATCPHKT